jgi:hypothetical protein
MLEHVGMVAGVEPVAVAEQTLLLAISSRQFTDLK